MHILIGIIGIIFFLALAFLFSSDRKNIGPAVCWYFISYPTCVRVYFIENDKEVLQLLGAFRKDLTTYYKNLQKGLTSCLADLSL